MVSLQFSLYFQLFQDLHILYNLSTNILNSFKKKNILKWREIVGANEFLSFCSHP